MQTKRCAIYTRKSSEEGLEQGFNSLHAQREACEAYVLSQAGEGWTALGAHYDDGGFSGGNMDRPGLKALLADIAAHRVDVVVVYKVDRLTRSLADFAKIVEQFDSQEVSFVSVTQAFNTTNSMGRLTLNVLLSFAQFEREVTGERIRDKIAASKAKGLVMGGRPPLGYDIKDSRYAVNEAEAPIVRRIFQRYAEGASVPMMAFELEADGVRSKAWTNGEGKQQGGAPFSRGALQHLLTNPVYRGGIRHKEKVYPDCHPAIIDEDLWARVQRALGERAYSRAATPRHTDAAGFKGRVVDDAGAVMQVIEAQGRTRRYLYYQSPARWQGCDHVPDTLKCISAAKLDQAIITAVSSTLAAGWRTGQPDPARVSDAVTQVVLSKDRLAIDLVRHALADPGPDGDEGVRRYFPLHLARRRGEILVGGHQPARKIDVSLARAVVMAGRWAGQIETGETGSIKALARENDLCEHYTAQLLPLAYLAPDLVALILDGRQPQTLTLASLVAKPLPLNWADQRRLFEI